MLTRREVLAITPVAAFGTAVGRAQAGQSKGSEGPSAPAAPPKKLPLPPKVELEEAVRLAKAHVKDNRIDTAGKYVASAELVAIKGGFSWRVTWMPVSGRTEDGWFMVSVSPVDGTAGHVTGK